jgi:hypothetical protein
MPEHNLKVIVSFATRMARSPARSAVVEGFPKSMLSPHREHFSASRIGLRPDKRMFPQPVGVRTPRSDDVLSAVHYQIQLILVANLIKPEVRCATLRRN